MYRTPAYQSFDEYERSWPNDTRGRLAWLSVEIQRIDAWVGQWSREHDGAPIPHAMMVLMNEKKKLEQDLWALAWEPEAAMPPPQTSFWDDIVARFKRR